MKRYLVALLILPSAALGQPVASSPPPTPPSAEEVQAQALVQIGQITMELGKASQQLIAANKRIVELQKQLGPKEGQPGDAPQPILRPAVPRATVDDK